MQSVDAPKRPAVSIVVPFVGTPQDAASSLEALEALELGSADEVLLVDNTPGGSLAELPPGGRFRRLEAKAEQSSYYSRNVGAEAARNDWLLFIDADCRPAPDLLARYFARPVEEDCAILAGEVRGDGRDSMLARYAESRRVLDSRHSSQFHPRPIGVTANLMVRREAWAEVGGFQEGIRSHGDAEFCWRVQEAGWRLIHRDEAFVAHAHRATLRALFRQHARYGAGAAWLNRRRPGSCPVPRPFRRFWPCAAGTVVWALGLQFERAAFKAIDYLTILGRSCGYLLSNTPPESPGARRARGQAEAQTSRTAVMVDQFPVPSETFVVEELRAMQRLKEPVRVEAIFRSNRPNPAVRELDLSYFEDDGILRRIAGVAWLAARHPLGAVRDLLTRRRWPESELLSSVALGTIGRRIARSRDRHLHVHFACTSAVTAARVSRLLGIPYSVTAHAYDIFKRPRALPAKLADAAFVTTGCDYNVRHLREQVLGGAPSPPVHKVIMGVDGERFRKRAEARPDGTVLGVGRLVEKKGFVDLVQAAAAPNLRGAVSRVVLVGDGPQRPELESLAERLDVSERVEFAGWRDAPALRDLLETAAVLVMPSVVASDGDRDSMPVAVKEALAMEVPVVASREVGLPEVVREEWGRLVPPRSPEALADAVAEVLARPVEERIAMGRAGRQFVLSHCDVNKETEKLIRLISEAANR